MTPPDKADKPLMPDEIFVDKDYPQTLDNRFSLKEKERQKYILAHPAQMEVAEAVAFLRKYNFSEQGVAAIETLIRAAKRGVT
ncbi:MAG: hypothetical protein WC091_02520 [Sulfuricellaceae bacterium]